MKIGKLASLSVVGILVATAILNSSCARTEEVAAQSNPSSDLPVVGVAKAAVENMSQGMILTAEFKPYQEVEVMAKVAGYVKRIQVDVGDRVKQGQLLAELEIPEMADDESRAQFTLERSKSEVSRARDELQRAESSHQIAHLSYTRLAEVGKQKPGLVAQQEIDDAHARDLVSEAQVSAAKSALTSAEQQVQVHSAELKKTKTLIDYSRVTAPFEGVVTKRYADTGSMIQAGTSSSTQVSPVVKISQNNLLRLILPVPESAVPTVHVGQQVEVRVPTLGRSFPGRVARFAEKLSSATRTMDTEVDVPNPNFLLIPGMFAEVNLTLQKKDGVLTVPVPAVDVGDQEATGQVFVVTAENKLDQRTVQLGLQSATSYEIRSGLHAGDLVVMSNRATLRKGQAVRPKLTEIAAQASR